ncbi:hypothetical protein MBLNU459_g5540t2 [Dothideomycetes sp. NU459]
MEQGERGQEKDMSGRLDNARDKEHDMDSKDEQVIVLLQRTFNVRISSGKRKKAFDIFCILSSDELLTAQHEQRDKHGHFPPISLAELSPAVHGCLKKPAARRELLRVGFSARQPSRVLMHHRPIAANPITGTPLHLMILLQPLSRILSFDVYLTYSTYAAECLKRVGTALTCGAKRKEYRELSNSTSSAR